MNFEEYQNKEEINCFELITQDEINSKIKEVEKTFNFDLSNLSVNVVGPKDDLFCKHEILYKLSRKGDLEEIIIKYFPDPYDLENLNMDDLKYIAEKEEILLNGELPGFAMTHGKDDIIFFNVKDKKIIEMANNYAKKEQEDLSFKNEEEAFIYLKKLANKALLHEIGHIIYSRNNNLFKKWKEYLESDCDNAKEIKNRVKQVQSDKYSDIEKISIEEEAFADFLIEILSNKKLSNRLWKNDEAINIINDCLKKI